MTREQLKSLTLVMLFGICVILVSQVWSGLNAGTLQAGQDIPAETYSKDKMRAVFCPRTIVANMGADAHTVVYSDRDKVWSAVQSGLLSFLSGKTAEREITPEQWIEKNRYRSFRMEFPTAIGMMDFYQLQGGDAVRFSGHDRPFTEMLISLEEPDTLYFFDAKQGKYFALTGQPRNLGLDVILNTLESSSEPDYEMLGELYALGDSTGNAKALNTTMVPRISVPSVPVYRTASELGGLGAEDSRKKIREIADAAFGNQFDFINRLTDVSGATVFMYGYGDKAFRVHRSGLMEFQAKAGDLPSSDRTGFLEAFQIAAAFAERVGGAKVELCLSGYTEPGTDGLRHFEFSYVMNDYQVVDTASTPGKQIKPFAPISVDVKGRQIVQFRRLVVVPQGTVDVSERWPEPLSLDEIISGNYTAILNSYMEATGDNSPMDPGIRFRLLDSIRSVRIVYCLNGSRDRLKPAWEIAFGEARFLFNIYTGEIEASDVQGGSK